LIHYYAALQPLDQLSGRYLIGQEIDISRIDREAMQGQRGAPADGPPAVPDSGKPLKRTTPRRTWATHGTTIRMPGDPPAAPARGAGSDGPRGDQPGRSGHGHAIW
jgi:hypothetical protein